MKPIDGEADAPPPATPAGPDPLDSARVAAVRDALQAGTLTTDTQLIAVRLLGWERLLTRT